MPAMTLDIFVEWMASQPITVEWIDKELYPEIMAYEDFIRLPEEQMSNVHFIEYRGQKYTSFQNLIQGFFIEIKKLSEEEIKSDLKNGTMLFVKEKNKKKTFFYYVDFKKVLENPENNQNIEQIEYDDKKYTLNDFKVAFNDSRLPQNLDPSTLFPEPFELIPGFEDEHRTVFHNVDFDKLKDKVFSAQQVAPVPATHVSQEVLREEPSTAAPHPQHQHQVAPVPATHVSQEVLRKEPSTAVPPQPQPQHQRHVRTTPVLVKRKNLLHKHPLLYFLLGGFLAAAVPFGIVAGVMSASGSAAALTAVISALPFLSFLGPLAPVFGVLAFAALVAAAALLVYEVVVAIAYAATAPKEVSASPPLEVNHTMPPSRATLPPVEQEQHYVSPVPHHLTTQPTVADRSCSSAQTESPATYP